MKKNYWLYKPLPGLGKLSRKQRREVYRQAQEQSEYGRKLVYLVLFDILLLMVVSLNLYVFGFEGRFILYPALLVYALVYWLGEARLRNKYLHPVLEKILTDKQ